VDLGVSFCALCWHAYIFSCQVHCISPQIPFSLSQTDKSDGEVHGAEEESEDSSFFSGQRLPTGTEPRRVILSVSVGWLCRVKHPIMS